MPKTVKAQQLIAVDPATGETYGIQIAVIPKRLVRGRWVRLFQDSKLAMLNAASMTGQSYRVLHYLEAVSGWDNGLPGTAAAAAALVLQQSHVSRAYRELIEAGFIIKRDGRYYLSPLVAWKGTQRAFDEACALLLPPQGMPALAPPRVKVLP